jgi:hypothetical protein
MADNEFDMVQGIPSVRMAAEKPGAIQPNGSENADEYPNPDGDQTMQDEMDSMLYARHVEIQTFLDLELQRGTPIPALFNQFYKYIQNPSSISVETYKRMTDTDDTIGSGLDFLTTCLAARLGRYEHPNKDITEWINDRLDEIEGGWTNAVKQIFSAVWAGFSVTEKVWANTEKGFVPKKLVTLPPSTLLFETDRVGDITEDGILQYQRNYNPALFGTGSSYLFGFTGFSSGQGPGVGRVDAFAKMGDLPFPLRTANTYSYLSIRIPRIKCIHYAFDAQGQFGNPYGRSMLRRAYKWYVMKDAFLQMLAVALDRKGTPLTVVFADPNTTLIDPRKATVGVSNKGKNVGIRADQAAQEAFRNIHNDTTIILPGKKGQTYDLVFSPSDANTQGFIESINLCNKGLMRALLIPSLIFTSGDGSGSFALGQEHAKTFDKVLDSMLAGFQQAFIDQLIKDMIAYNFPKEVWQEEGFGKFSKREMSQDEIQKELEAVKTAFDMGAVDINDLKDLNKVRDMVSFDERDTPIENPMQDLFDQGGDDGTDGSDDGASGGNLPADGGGGKGDIGKPRAPNGGDKPAGKVGPGK